MADFNLAVVIIDCQTTKFSGYMVWGKILKYLRLILVRIQILTSDIGVRSVSSELVSSSWRSLPAHRDCKSLSSSRGHTPGPGRRQCMVER